MGVSAHNGVCSCAFCDFQFDSLDNNQRDYSNLDIDTFPRRTKATHSMNSARYLQSKTQTERDERKKGTGTAYSIFQELSYFDCINFQAIDILHCSYLGITKRILRMIWLDIGCTVESNQKLLSNNDLKEMSQLLAKDFVFPFGFDGQSISRKLLVGDGAGYLKGDEIRVFLLVSPYLLQGRLTYPKYTNFMKFVEINRLLNSPGLYMQDIKRIKTLSKEFMQEFLQLYNDAKFLSANFHLFLHLPETILRFSTPCNFWLFFYESLNADVKGINTNNNSNNNIEKTFFDRFLSSIYSEDMFDKLPRPAMPLHSSIFDSLEALFSAPQGNMKKRVSAIMKTEYQVSKKAFDLDDYLQKEKPGISHDEEDNGCESDTFFGLEILPPSAAGSIDINYDKPATILSDLHYSYLVEYYNVVYNNTEDELYHDRYVGGVRGTISTFDGEIIPVSNLVRRFKQVKLFGYLYKSFEGTSSKTKRGSYVMAYCHRSTHLVPSPAPCLRPGQIIFLFRHAVSVRDANTGRMFEN